MTKKKIIPGSSPKAKNLSARLMAVQVVYQALHNQHSLQKVLEEYLAYRTPPTSVDGEPLVQPDGALLKTIVSGVEERHSDLEAMIKAAYSKENGVLEPLLKAILLCGAWELLGNTAVDGPIVINDYLNVTHSFYEQGEVSLVNGILDSIAKTLKN